MMDGIVGIMKKVAVHEARAIYTTELGIVTAVFPHAEESDKDNYQCSVKLKNKTLPDGKDFELRKVPVATPYMGLVCIPNVDDLVLINFIAGDINAPVITGRLYNDKDRPPENKKDEFLLQHKIKEGGNIKLDEEGRIIITSKDEENVFTLEDEQISMVNEKFSIVIDISEETITITSDKDLTLSAGNKCVIEAKEIEIKSEKTMIVEAGDTMDITSSKAMTMESSDKMDIKSSKAMKVESSDKMDMKGSSGLNIEGAKMDIKASGAMTLKGSTIDLN